MNKWRVINKDALDRYYKEPPKPKGLPSPLREDFMFHIAPRTVLDLSKLRGCEELEPDFLGSKMGIRIEETKTPAGELICKLILPDTVSGTLNSTCKEKEIRLIHRPILYPHRPGGEEVSLIVKDVKFFEQPKILKSRLDPKNSNPNILSDISDRKEIYIIKDKEGVWVSL